MIEGVEKLLTDLGFKRDGDRFDKIENRIVQQTIINGQRHDETAQIKITIEYIGDGWIRESEESGTPLDGYKLTVNNQDQGDIWVSCIEEFKQLFGIND